MMNLDTTLDIDLKKFFQWWGRELALLVPIGLRQRLRDRHGCLVFSSQKQGYQVSFLDDEDNLIVEKPIDLVEADSYPQFKNQYPAIDKAHIVLRLTAEQALQKVIYLPIATQENLRQVVAFELDRYTPFKAEQVYFNVVVLGKTEQGQIRVLLIVIPKNYLDQQLELMDASGARPHRVDYQSTLNDYPQISDAYNLLPELYRQRGSKLSQSIHWLFSGVLLLLTLAVLIVPVWMEGRAVDSLKHRINQLEKQTRIVEAQQMEIDALRAENQKMIDIKHQTPALLPILAELSTLLKDDTWLTHFQYSAKHMQIQGQSPAASALISLLENSDYFSQVSFVSPLTQDKATGRERFQISLNVSMPVSGVATFGEAIEAPIVDESALPGQATPETAEEEISD